MSQAPRKGDPHDAKLTRRGTVASLASLAIAGSVSGAVPSVELRPPLRSRSRGSGVRFGCAAAAPLFQKDQNLLAKMASEAEIFEYADPESERRRQAILSLLQRLHETNRPIDCFGLQSHLTAHLPFDSKVLAAFLTDVVALGYHSPDRFPDAAQHSLRR